MKFFDTAILKTLAQGTKEVEAGFSYTLDTDTNEFVCDKCDKRQSIHEHDKSFPHKPDCPMLALEKEWKN